MYGVVKPGAIPMHHTFYLGHAANKHAPYTIYIDLFMLWVRFQASLLASVLWTVLSLILLAPVKSCSIATFTSIHVSVQYIGEGAAWRQLCKLPSPWLVAWSSPSL